MWANMYCTFRIDGGKVILDRIDLDTDGATSKVTGVVDIARWPEQTYDVVSQVDFPRGEGHLVREAGLHRWPARASSVGTFKLFKGGRDLTGTFKSPEAGLNAFRFPNLAGRLRWLPDRFEVTEASSGFYGGRATFSYTMAPIGAADTGDRAVRRDVRATSTSPRSRSSWTCQDCDLPAGSAAGTCWSGPWGDSRTAAATASCRPRRPPGPRR